MGGAIGQPVNEDNAEHSYSREVRRLLGNFDRLDPVAHRLISLGRNCLTATNIGTQHNHFRQLEKFNNCNERVTDSSYSHDLGSNLDDNEVDQWTRHTDDASNHGAVGNNQYDSDLFVPIHDGKPMYMGQTYPIWKSMYNFQNIFQACVPTRKIIYIQPIDKFPDFMTKYRMSVRGLSVDMFSLLQGFTQIFFSGLDVALLSHVSMDDMGWTDLVKLRRHSLTEELQYRAKDFYPLLQKQLASDGHCIIGLIWTDLYPEDDLNFVLGETSFQHRSGIFCFGRFETKGFNKLTHKDISEVDGDFIWKIIRVLSHELCHLFGLRHCTYFQCSMNESTSLDQALGQPLFLCPVCLRKLHQVCQFDVLDRYTQLLAFLRDVQSCHDSVHITRAISWLENCIAFLQQPSNLP